MGQLILIRHGQSIANAERRFTTGPDEALSDLGRAEADETGVQIRRRYDPVALYASPFARAFETGERVGRHLGLAPQVVEDLREQFFGELRGRPYDDYRVDPSATGVGRWSHRPPGGESLAEVAIRAGTALDQIARRHVGESVVVVSHGGVMAALRAHVAGGYDAPPQPTRNAYGYLLRFESGVYTGPLDLEFDS